MLDPRSAVKIEAYTTENNYIQPWVIYAWRSYEEQTSGLYIVPFEVQHFGSADIQWEMEASGILKVAIGSASAPTVALRITRLELLRGDVQVFMPLKADKSPAKPKV